MPMDERMPSGTAFSAFELLRHVNLALLANDDSCPPRNLRTHESKAAMVQMAESPVDLVQYVVGMRQPERGTYMPT